MYKLTFYVPEQDAEAVKEAVFDAGAGRCRLYDRCCWQTAGQGQFRPLEGSHPAVGRRGRLERVPELRVDMICRPEHLAAALAALRRAHPYEEPAFEVVELAKI